MGLERGFASSWDWCRWRGVIRVVLGPGGARQSVGSRGGR